MENVFDLIIVGSGAGGLSAALYAGRYRMRVVVFGDHFGGYTAVAGPIGNYPGYVEVDGFDLMMTMKEQAEALGTIIKDEKVVGVTQNDGCFSVTTEDGKEYSAGSIIFAPGTERRQLGLPNEKELTSKGVHYCATCDGPAYSGKIVAMIGGGDSSVKGVNLVAEYAKKTYLITRSKELRAEPINFERMQKLVDEGRVEIVLENQVVEIVGTNKLEKIVLAQPLHGSQDLVLDGVFIEIGSRPRSELARSLGVTLDEKGHILAGTTMETNVPGVFAAGDIVSGTFKQSITAAAQGAVAATAAYQYHKMHGNRCGTRPESPV